MVSVEHNLPEMYQHFKGDYYVLVRIAKHHSNGKPWAVYRPLADEDTLYIRPMGDFLNQVVVPHNSDDKTKVPRFRLVPEEESSQVILDGLRKRAEQVEAEAETDEEKIIAGMGRRLVNKLEERLSGKS